MAIRFSNSEKYKDPWFLELPPSGKLLFYFLIDNVDHAGFWEVSLRSIDFFLGLGEKQFEQAEKSLEKVLIYSNDGDTIYFRNFLKHQKNIPLNKYNNAHKSIIEIFRNGIEKFKSNKEFFINIPCCHVLRNRDGSTKITEENLGATLGLNRPSSKSKSNSSRKWPQFNFFRDEFEEVWRNEYLPLKVKKKASVTERALLMGLNKINEFAKGDYDIALAILNRSVNSGYTDFYEDNNLKPKQKVYDA